ncbi:cbb3-type cytochrome c oxidase subunit I [archaeon]|nr:cbb3-type cytochrome c oxidase subunit I [archaeon]
MTKKISLNFLGMAIVYFLVAAVLGTLMLAGIVTPTKMLKTAHTHIALLGFVSATIIGTMYQQVPTLTAADLHSKKMARASFWLFNVGVVAMFLTFVFTASSAPVLSASLVMLGILLFAYNILMTLMDRKGTAQVLKFYGAAVFYFVLASIIGVSMLLGYSKGMIITAHTHLALLGFVSIIIIGAMAWMFPMMVMRDLQKPKLLDVVFWLFNIGTVGLFAGFVFQGYGMLTKVSGVIVGLSVLLFAYQMFLTTLAKSKMPAAPKSTEAKFFKAAIFYFAAATLLGVLMLFGKGGYITGMKTLHVHIALIGFVSVTIFGGFYHVIPMLVWTLITEKLKDGGARGPSSFKELYSDGLAMAIFVLVNAGVVGLFIGLALSINSLATASAIAITASGVIFAGDMLRMILKS